MFVELFKSLNLNASQLPVTTIIVFLVFAIILAAISAVNKRPLEINLGIFKLKFGSNDGDAQAIDINRTIEIVLQKNCEINKLESGVFVRQMNFFDEKLVEVKSIMVDEFATLLSKKLEKPATVRVEQAFRNYKMLIDLMMENVKINVFKKSMELNHLATKSVDEWESFIDRKINIIFASMKSFLDDNYPEDVLVDREELDDLNERLYNKIRTLFVLAFRNAREVRIEHDEKIVHLKLALDEEIKKELDKLKKG